MDKVTLFVSAGEVLLGIISVVTAVVATDLGRGCRGFAHAGRHGQSIPLGMRSKVFLVLFVHKENSSRRSSDQIARRRLKRGIVKMHLCVLTGFPQARENAAERKRSRSEADTGQGTGASFGLCSCDSQSRAGRSLRPRRPATRHARFRPRRLRPLELRTNATEWGGALGRASATLSGRAVRRHPHAADCNSTGLVAFTAGGELHPQGAPRMNRRNL